MSHIALQFATMLWLSSPPSDASVTLTSPYGPIATKPTSGKHISVESIENGSRLVQKALGREVTTPRMVLFFDKNAFGEYRESRALLYDDMPVAVTNEDLVDTVVVSAAVGVESGSILAVYTREKPSWVARVGSERDPEAEAAKFSWNVNAAGASEVVTTVANVLAAVWRNYGFRPSEAGQIVLRPRLATTSIPRVAKGPNGMTVGDSDESVGMTWVVQVLGVRRDVTPTFYWTGYLILVDDRTGQPIKGLSMP